MTEPEEISFEELLYIEVGAFGEDMDWALRTFRDKQHLNSGREGCMEALREVMDFMSRLQFHPDREKPLRRIFEAFENAENGTADPLFAVTRKKRGGRPHISVVHLQQRGYLAAIVEGMKQGGMSLDLAARWVARHAPQLPGRNPTERQTVSWTTLKKWRTEASEGSDRADAVVFKQALKQFANGAPVGEAAAKILLEMTRLKEKLQKPPGQMG